MTHTEKIAAVVGGTLLVAAVVTWLFHWLVVAVWWWPLVGSEWRAERAARKTPDHEWHDPIDLPGVGEPDWDDEPSSDDDADQMIATWHGEQDERIPTPANVWDLWWAELDGLDRECLKVRATVEHQDRLWAELVQETRQLCPLAVAA